MLVALGDSDRPVWTIEAAGRTFAVFRVDGELYVTDARTTAGRWTRGGTLVCPWQWYRFDLRTGEDEAAVSANDTPYGLNAMLFTENLSRAHRVAAALLAGTVWVNCFFIRDLRAPFGGAGDSGMGREGGDFSREFFTEPKAVVMAIS
jgi:nitrite reductase/ring-hydroxylating ferredoxin subunit